MSQTFSPYFTSKESQDDMKPIESSKLTSSFYNQDASSLAQSLLGKILVRQFESKERICGRIVETEAYLGIKDKASHSFNHKQTFRTKPMFMKPGTIYIYSIYGMYHCMNISSRGDGAAVLLRAVEPLEGLDRMKSLRCQKQKTQHQRPFHQHQFCNGPSKICLSYGIHGKELNEMDIASSSSTIWIEDRNCQPQFETISCARIGLGRKAEEWINAPLRFYVSGSTSVSITDPIAQKLKSSTSWFNVIDCHVKLISFGWKKIWLPNL